MVRPQVLAQGEEHMRIVVPAEGVEPPRAEAHESLSPARLPVPPARRLSLVYCLDGPT